MNNIEQTKRYPLTDQKIQTYRSDGFIQISNLFTGQLLQQLRETVASAVAQEQTPDDEPNRTKGAYEQLFIQKVNLWRPHPAVAQFVLSHYIGDVAARLEGVPMRIWHDQALFKEPKSGNNRTPWHQDAVYWPHQTRKRQTTVWIALKDATIHNGCMSFVPTTHTLGPLPAINLADPQDIFAYVPHIKPVKPVTIELPAGSATFHNGLTFHYAGPNKSDTTREAFAIIYMPDGTTFAGESHMVTDPLELNVGAKLEGDLFPIVGVVKR